MTAPLVSVVVPCFNTHGTINRTIDSLRRQSHAPVEIIVVDDGSTNPDTIACLDALGPDVRLIRQANRGLAGARNAGIEAAQGDFILPLDSDDWLEPDAVAALLAALTANPQAGFAFCHLHLEGEAAGILPKQYNFFEQLFLNQLPYCLLQRKADWRRLGGYDEAMRRGYEDWDYNIRLGDQIGDGIVVPRALFHYQVARTGMLLSLSNGVHGELWGYIRAKQAALYQPGRLIALWQKWRRQPSAYPLWIYFGWLLLAICLPMRLFNALFARLRTQSQANRTTRRERGTGDPDAV